MPPALPSRSRLILAAIALLHLLVLLGWNAIRPPPRPQPGEGRGSAWVWILPRHSAQAPRSTPAPTPAFKPPRRPRAPAIVDPAPAEQATALSASPRAPTELPAAPVPDDPFATPAPNEAERTAALLAQARRAAGTVDQQLRREAPRRPERLHVPGAQERLASGIANAAVRRGIGPAQIEEINPGDHSGDRLYRITGMLGTYCMRYPSPRRGIDNYSGSPKIVSCPN